jgi:ABC-type nitrate/sulfonate/bicarbonate transport system substrate-binding protein
VTRRRATSALVKEADHRDPSSSRPHRQPPHRGRAGRCGGNDEEGSTQNQRLSISLGMPSSDTFTAEWFGFLAARDLGYWDQQGLDVKLVAAEGSGAVVEQIVAGNLDAGIPSMTAVVEAMGTGVELINTYTYSRGAIFGIFAAEQSGISSLPDLEGKKIGISEPGGGEVAFLNAALRGAGIDPAGGVTPIPIGDGGPATFEAIKSGKVDAYSSAYNDVFAMQVQGLQLKDLTPEEFKGFPARGVIATPQVVEEKQEAIGRLLNGVAQGTLYCLTNNDACAEMMKKAVPQQWEANAQGVSQGTLRYELGLKQVALPEGFRYGQHSPEETQQFVDTVASTSKEFQRFDVNTFLSQEFLDRANDFDQQAIIDQAKK